MFSFRWRFGGSLKDPLQLGNTSNFWGFILVSKLIRVGPHWGKYLDFKMQNIETTSRMEWRTTLILFLLFSHLLPFCLKKEWMCQRWDARKASKSGAFGFESDGRIPLQFRSRKPRFKNLTEVLLSFLSFAYCDFLSFISFISTHLMVTHKKIKISVEKRMNYSKWENIRLIDPYFIRSFV